MKRPNILVGTDIGGTFTDIFVYSAESNVIEVAKFLTTQTDPSNALLEGISTLLGKVGIDPHQVDVIAHATTLATNALIERKGAAVGLLTTNGFRDITEVGYEQMYDLYDIHLDVPPPLVPRSRRRPVQERIGYDGSIIQRVALDQVERETNHLVDQGVQAIAVCFLHSYANPVNELAVKKVLSRLAPEISVSLSYEVLPEIGEFGRFSTTLVNAYVQPVVNSYLNAVADQLEKKGVERKNLKVVSSRGQSIDTDQATKFPVRLLESGPAAGVYAASQLAKVIKKKKTLSFDMGGTSAKVCLIDEYEPQVTMEFEAARIARFKKKSGIPVRTPVIDLIEIGAGGGSIASVDARGLPVVGPQSAGSDPGPACYALGGKEVTVTDADLLLGYLNPSNFLGGELRLDQAAAESAIRENFSHSLGLGVAEAAWQIVQLVNDQMARAAIVHAAEMGFDLGKFTMFAFGGAGPVHAAFVASLLGIKQVTIPPFPGVLSAVGTAMTPKSFDLARSYKIELTQINFEKVNQLYDQLFEQVSELFGTDIRNDSSIERKRSVDMRYLNQRYEVTVDLPDKDKFSDKDIPEIEKKFAHAYQSRYHRLVEGIPLEAVTFRLSVTGEANSLPIRSRPLRSQTEMLDPLGESSRPAYFLSKFYDTLCIQREFLESGVVRKGPVIIEENGATTVVPPDWSVEQNKDGYLFLRR